MATLNDYNDKTKKVIHLMVTSLCLRNCPHCCNKQYDLNDIPYVTDEELKECEVLCLTGGEPFEFANPEKIAIYYKKMYKNIKKVYVYTNALELYNFCRRNYLTYTNDIDGYNISIKTKADVEAFYNMKDYSRFGFKENRLYVFDELITEPTISTMTPYKWVVTQRNWQEDFKPADDSIFRKV